MENRFKWLAAMAILGLFPAAVMAGDGGGHDAHAEHVRFATVLLFVVGLLVCGRIGAIVQRWGFPSVLGELLAGILLWNVAVNCGWSGITNLRDDALTKFIAFIGVVLLLFKTGLEESLTQMVRVGGRATVVALVGMVVPFVLGFGLSMAFFPGSPFVTHTFVGACLVATSVGITAKMFDDLGYKTKTKTLVVGAAVADDVGGLIVLAVVSVMADGGQVTAWLIAKTTLGALGFLVGAVVLGCFTAPVVGRALSTVHTGVGMKKAMALAFCALFAWAALVTVGLEPIVGAFAAGLVLNHVHFKSFDAPRQVGLLTRWISMLQPGQTELRHEMEEQKHAKEHTHVESLIEGVARFFVPVFFVHTGMHVNLAVFTDPVTVGMAVTIAAAAIVGKLACGFIAGKQANRWVTGWAMVARGEVGLVFANLAHAKGVFTDQVFAVAIVVVVITTFIPPMVLPRLIRHELAQK